MIKYCQIHSDTESKALFINITLLIFLYACCSINIVVIKFVLFKAHRMLRPGLLSTNL